MPNALRVLTHTPGMPQMILRTISQTRITYRGTAFSEGRAGDIGGGDTDGLSGTIQSVIALDKDTWRCPGAGRRGCGL